jgi:hypothetical protein
LAKAVEAKLLCRIRAERLAALPEIDQLSRAEAVPILRKGMRHWDRDLRRACAQKLLDKIGIAAAPEILKLCRAKRLSKPAVAAMLGGHRTHAFVDQVLKESLERDDKVIEWVAATLLQEDSYAQRKLQRLREQQRRAFVGAERKREATRAAERVRRRRIIDFPALVEALSAPQQVIGFLFGQWMRDQRAFDRMYEELEIPKRSGGTRLIHAPGPALKIAQRALLENVLSKAPLHDACHGFRRDHSTKTNASPHVGRDIVINLDLRDFFPTISAGRVAGVLRQLEIPGGTMAQHFLVDLVTRERRLPQGAPTSPALANLVCRRLDSRLAGLAAKAGASYTRYADDLTFSGDGGLVSCLPKIRAIIASEGLTVATEKTRVIRKGGRQDVTGLTVNAGVSVPRAIRRRLRAVAHRVACGGMPTWKGEDLNAAALRGHLSYLRAFHPQEADRLVKQVGGVIS